MTTKNKALSNPYGYFDAETREYAITQPDTPTPWFNYLGEGRYGGIISNTGGGFSFDRDPKNRRVSRYRYNAIPMDQPGRYVYIRDMESGKFWSPTWQPTPEVKLGSYECRHGAGYTRIASSHNGIAARLLYFVPPAPKDESCPCELWVLTLKNTGKKPRKLRTFSYVEFSFRDALGDQLNLDWCQHILEARVKDGIITSKTRFAPTTNFFGSSVKPAGFDTDREVFVGRWRDLSNPEVVERGKPSNFEAPRGNNIGSLCHNVTLRPGQEKEIVFVMGVTDEPARIPAVVARFRDPENVVAAFTDLRADWDDYLGRFTVDTPDPVVNAMLNVWNPIQCRTTLFWSRFVSAYETGTGRGMGTRDSAQDTLGTVHNAADRARATLSMLWHLQYKDGHTWHQVLPLTGEGGPGLASEFPAWPQWFCDDHLWLILGVCAYLRETGDLAYLDEKIDYTDGGSDSVWNHMMCAIEFTLQHRGPQGLPRIGFADWDDTMNVDHGSGKAESVWCGQQFCRALLDLAELSQHMRKTDDANRFRALHAEMAGIINKVAWDGDWYARAFDDQGKPIGVKSEAHHRIALNTQTWAVIGDAAPADRGRRAMEQAHEKLNSKFGLALLWPAYTEGDERVRGTTTYPPGAKENGGIFCHANTWAIVAAAKLGMAERAMQYYLQITPFMRRDVDVMKVEPYVYCGNVTGPEHKQYGYARNAWLSGTASWTYVAGTQWILGIRPTYSGLTIAPMIPEKWKGFKATRLYRGVRYFIEVKRAGKGSTVQLTVDGQAIAGCVVPPPAAGTKEVKVEVRLG
ncbi:MAG TPA: glycosyl transferase family 36 [Polyangia bacterium]|jgi:Cellobiose phosphorylase|nr:glycosyl transferase family 36 [Polyangia bacterium]